MKKYLIPLLSIITLFSCSNNQYKTVDPKGFDTTIQKKKVELITLKNRQGITVQITNLGGRIVSIFTPDKKGHWADIALGFDHANDYLHSKEPYFGALIGRCANRIGNSTYSFDGVDYTLEPNEGKNQLHGGPHGFNTQVWNISSKNDTLVALSYFSKEGEGGYPGNVNTTVTYTLTKNSTLKMEYNATTDQTTPINLTNHAFFNLKGAGNGTINSSILTIHADRFTPVNDQLIPTGEIKPVEDTPFDFRTPKTIGENLNKKSNQFKLAGGFDHNWVIDTVSTSTMRELANVYEPSTGRTLSVWSTEPALQFYGGNMLDGTIQGKGGKMYKYREAFCLETQHFPDSPNHPNFPSIMLHPHQSYHVVSEYRFGIKE